MNLDGEREEERTLFCTYLCLLLICDACFFSYNEAREARSTEPFVLGFPRKKRLFISDRIRG